ncbi:MAG TPA: multidrug effflux MFS transporter [Roseiarcus sp.]|jgi:DHA1 family bicyclomycin/chloramphenicol resistance-like MFS transporter
MALRPHSLGFTLLIAALAALPPLSIDMSLPAADRIGAALDAPASQTGLTLSLFMLGFALAQLGFGPLSDRFGRRAPLLAACALFAGSGFFCAFAGAIHTLLVWRFVEGAGAGGASVLAFAIVRDLFEGAQARARMATISAVMTAAPMLAPTIGALILQVAEWRVIFLALAFAGCALVLVVGFFVEESHRAPDTTALAFGRLTQSYARALTHRSSIGHALLGALSFGCLFSFVSASPFVFISVLGLSAGWFAILFAVSSLGLTAGSLLCGRLSKLGVDPRRLLAAGVLAQAVLSVALLALALLGAFRVADALPLIVLNNIAMGVVGPLAAHGALEPFPEMAGVASAVRGCLQMLSGAAASALVAWLFAGTPTALPLAMAIFAIASCLTWALTLQGATGERERREAKA